MERIAKDANVARRTVYNQFESKKALFDATIGRLWRRNPIADIVKGITAGSSPEQGLLLIGSSIVNFWVPDESIAFLRMMIAESVQFPELGKAFVDTGRNPARQAIAEYLRKLHQQGRLHVTDADFATAQFVELVVGQRSGSASSGTPGLPLSRCKDTSSPRRSKCSSPATASENFAVSARDSGFSGGRRRAE